MSRAEEIINLHNREETKMADFRNLCQQVADLMYPASNDITVTTTPGRDLSLDIRDPSALFALDRAAAGYIANWIPKDRLFCGIRLMNREVAELEKAKRWCSLATQILHDEIFASNYMQQLQMTVKSLLAFGLANSYSEFSDKNWHIKTFIFKENSRGVPDCVSVKFTKTARQLCEEFANPGPEVTLKANNLKTESDPYDFIHIARPRIRRNRWLVDNLNMPYESLYVNVKEKIVVEEGGFEYQPYTVSRWEHSTDKYGRGRGTTVLSLVKELQQMHKDFIEMGNRFNRFPLEVVRDDLENEQADMSPDAQNYVRKLGTIGAVNNGITGNFPVTREILEYFRDMIKNDGFYNDIFSQFMSLRGDRRVQLELELRNQEGLDQLVTSVSNVESEYFTPQLTRCVILLLKNGRIPPPPQELQGQDFGIEYMGKLAMAAEQYQARGFLQMSQIVANFKDVYPEMGDIINLERTIPDVARAVGMKEEHINTPEEIDAKRQQREQEKQQMMQMAQMQAESQAYKNTQKSPESGSPAEGMVG